MTFAERILETLRWRPVHPRPAFVVYAPPAIGGRERSEVERPRRNDVRRRRPRPAPCASVSASAASSPLCAADAAV